MGTGRCRLCTSPEQLAAERKWSWAGVRIKAYAMHSEQRNMIEHQQCANEMQTLLLSRLFVWRIGGHTTVFSPAIAPKTSRRKLARRAHPPENCYISYSSSSSPASSPSSFFSAALAFFLRTRPGRPPPNGDVSAKSMCFCESSRTMNDGTLTIWRPTL